MATRPLYKAFIGSWNLIPESCQYEQGHPPQRGQYTIEEFQGELRFGVKWTAFDGTEHQIEFSGTPNGQPQPFSGGELADALAICPVSERELNSVAYLHGREIMVAQRQLDETARAMRVTQIVRLPDGTRPANVAIYRLADESPKR